MPKSATHTAKRKKNLAVLAILVGICAGLFFLTIVKMQALQ